MLLTYKHDQGEPLSQISALVQNYQKLSSCGQTNTHCAIRVHYPDHVKISISYRLFKIIRTVSCKCRPQKFILAPFDELAALLKQFLWFLGRYVHLFIEM